jgi:hypothetical protein
MRGRHGLRRVGGIGLRPVRGEAVSAGIALSGVCGAHLGKLRGRRWRARFRTALGGAAACSRHRVLPPQAGES